MSQHIAEVVPITIEPHNNSDNLGIVKIGSGFQCVVNKEQWCGETTGVYIMPDSIVDVTRPEFSFLNKGRDKERVKCVRLRGEFSQGLLVKTPDGFNVGDNLWEYFALDWYEPEIHLSTTSDFKLSPNNWGGLSKYDIENARRSEVSQWFVDGEEVVAMIKLNGSNTSFVFSDSEIHVRSRSGFRKDVSDCLFWRSFRSNPNIERFCRENTDILLYGETVGQVKGFKYDCNPNEVKFYVFDIMANDRKYMNVDDLIATCNKYSLPLAPIVYRGPLNISDLTKLAEDKCPLGNGISEGIVFRPVLERRCGNERVIGKIVSNQYLMKS